MRKTKETRAHTPEKVFLYEELQSQGQVGAECGVTEELVYLTADGTGRIGVVL